MTNTESPAEPEGITTTPPAKSTSPHRWVVLAWFLLGMLLGIVGIAAYTRLATTSSPAPLDTVAMREAARLGTLDAIATLQAGGQPAEIRGTSTPVVVETAFAARPANQIGSQDAAVTIVEFSDFQ